MCCCYVWALFSERKFPFSKIKSNLPEETQYDTLFEEGRRQSEQYQYMMCAYHIHSNPQIPIVSSPPILGPSNQNKEASHGLVDGNIPHLVRSIWRRRVGAFFTLFAEEEEEGASAGRRGRRAESERVEVLLDRFGHDYKRLWAYLGQHSGVRLPPLIPTTTSPSSYSKNGTTRWDTEGTLTTREQCVAEASRLVAAADATGRADYGCDETDLVAALQHAERARHLRLSSQGGGGGGGDQPQREEGYVYGRPLVVCSFSDAASPFSSELIACQVLGNPSNLPMLAVRSLPRWATVANPRIAALGNIGGNGGLHLLTSSLSPIRRGEVDGGSAADAGYSGRGDAEPLIPLDASLLLRVLYRRKLGAFYAIANAHSLASRDDGWEGCVRAHDDGGASVDECVAHYAREAARDGGPFAKAAEEMAAVAAKAAGAHARSGGAVVGGRIDGDSDFDSFLDSSSSDDGLADSDFDDFDEEKHAANTNKNHRAGQQPPEGDDDAGHARSDVYFYRELVAFAAMWEDAQRIYQFRCPAVDTSYRALFRERERLLHDAFAAAAAAPSKPSAISPLIANDGGSGKVGRGGGSSSPPAPPLSLSPSHAHAMLGATTNGIKKGRPFSASLSPPHSSSHAPPLHGGRFPESLAAISANTRSLLTSRGGGGGVPNTFSSGGNASMGLFGGGGRASRHSAAPLSPPPRFSHQHESMYGVDGDDGEVWDVATAITDAAADDDGSHLMTTMMLRGGGGGVGADGSPFSSHRGDGGFGRGSPAAARDDVSGAASASNMYWDGDVSVFPDYPDVQSRSAAIVRNRNAILNAQHARQREARRRGKGGAVAHDAKADYDYDDRVGYDGGRWDSLTTEEFVAGAYFAKREGAGFDGPRHAPSPAVAAAVDVGGRPPIVPWSSMIAPTASSSLGAAVASSSSSPPSSPPSPPQLCRTTTLLLVVAGVTFEQYRKELSAEQRADFNERLVVDLSRAMLGRRGDRDICTAGAIDAAAASGGGDGGKKEKKKDKKDKRDKDSGKKERKDAAGRGEEAGADGGSRKSSKSRLLDAAKDESPSSSPVKSRERGKSRKGDKEDKPSASLLASEPKQKGEDGSSRGTRRDRGDNDDEPALERKDRAHTSSSRSLKGRGNAEAEHDKEEGGATGGAVRREASEEKEEFFTYAGGAYSDAALVPRTARIIPIDALVADVALHHASRGLTVTVVLAVSTRDVERRFTPQEVGAWAPPFVEALAAHRARYEGRLQDWYIPRLFEGIGVVGGGGSTRGGDGEGEGLRLPAAEDLCFRQGLLLQASGAGLHHTRVKVVDATVSTRTRAVAKQ